MNYKTLLATTAITGMLLSSPAEARYYYNPAGAIFGALIGIGMGMAMRPPAYGYYPPPVYRAPPPPQTNYPPPPTYQNGVGQQANPNSQPLTVNLICEQPIMLSGGGGPDTNPVVSVEVTYSDDHSWRVFHHFQQGGVVSRGAQYSIVDMSDNGRVQWKGVQLRDSSRVMIGEIRLSQDKQHIYYLEWAYWNGVLQMNSRAQCYLNGPIQPPATSSAAPAVPPASANANAAIPANPPPVIQAIPPSNVKDTIPIYPTNNGKGVLIDVLLGGQPVRMLLDTGADVMSINEDVADTLLKSGAAEVVDIGKFQMADGRTVTQPVIMVHEIRIGSHVLRNIKAAVSDGDLLIGFPIINEIGPFKIDTRNRELVFG